MKGQPAKVLLAGDVRALVAAARRSRHPDRNVVIVLLSTKAGLPACEIAALTWPMVLDAGGEVASMIEIPAAAKKGSGRRIPMHPMLKAALKRLQAETAATEGPVVCSERGGPMTAKSVVNWFTGTFDALGLDGCSSHSGRRTFITEAARLVHCAGGSLLDV
ncbi:tyrosine-type recombinase/integrase [Faunimonas sp. B44]|uniref:tyrosine-type recombinase/integrase n=1 Tax=Faunimonas sp. B44 TaxID=3461493 RepID=UPI004044A8CD